MFILFANVEEMDIIYIEETTCFVVGFFVGRKDSLREGGHSIEEDYGALYGRLSVLPQRGASDGRIGKGVFGL